MLVCKPLSVVVEYVGQSFFRLEKIPVSSGSVVYRLKVVTRGIRLVDSLFLVCRLISCVIVRTYFISLTYYIYIYIFIYKIIRILCALSLVNRYVWMRVCKHCCDITQILIGDTLSDTGSWKNS